MSGAGWKWIAPDNWPAPPEGWAPHPGWHPDPAWPPPPPGHQFWRGSRRAWLPVALIMIAWVACVAMFGTFIAVASSLGTCAFDLPPGDVASVTLTNDMARVVTFEDCLNSHCTQRDGVDSSGPVSPGASIDQNHKLCSEDWVAIRDSNGHLLGCVVLPAEDPAKVTQFYASASTPCP